MELAGTMRDKIRHVLLVWNKLDKNKWNNKKGGEISWVALSNYLPGQGKSGKGGGKRCLHICFWRQSGVLDVRDAEGK